MIPGLMMPPGLIATAAPDPEPGPDPWIWQTVTVGQWGEDTYRYGYRNWNLTAGSLTPTVSESGHTVVEVSCSENNTFFLRLVGNIAAGTLRYNVGPDSLLLSSMFRSFDAVRNHTLFSYAAAPTWMRIDLGDPPFDMRLSAT